MFHSSAPSKVAADDTFIFFLLSFEGRGWKGLLIQTWYPVLAMTRKCSKFKKAVILSKMNFSFSER